MTDEGIIALYFERSEQAIEETEKAYGRYFYTVAYGILCDREDAQEVVNETYLQAWESIPPHRPNPLKTFLAKITRNLSINRLKANRRNKRGRGEYPILLDEIAEVISENDGDDLVDLIALRDSLNRFLRSLKADARRVFLKRYWYMQSIFEIAKSLSMSESRVKSLLMRTREKLKIHLTKEGFAI